MDETIFKKLKVKEGMRARVFNKPPAFPLGEGIEWEEDGDAAYVHLFAESRAQLAECFEAASASAQEDGLFWVSYPKAAGKQKPDINRDSLWDLVVPLGWHPVAQVSLDDRWSAVRLRPNEPTVEYSRPNKK